MNKLKQLQELTKQFQKTLSKKYDESWDENKLLDDFFFWTQNQINLDQEKFIETIIQFQKRLEEEHEILESKYGLDWWEGWSSQQDEWNDLSKKFLKFCNGRI